MYKKFPRQMLRSRVISEGVRTLWPLATSGFYEPGEAADIPAKDEHNGPTIEPDTRDALNDQVPLKAAAASTPRAPVVRGPAEAPVERTDEQWQKWLDKLRGALGVLYRRDEVVEIAGRKSIADATADGPPWVRREIASMLAEAYARFPEDEPPPDDGTEAHEPATEGVA
jgi:hypothetical protein